MRRLIVFFLTTAVILASRSSQRTQLDTFRDVKVVKITNFMGELNLVPTEKELEVRSEVFFEAGSSDLSKELLRDTEIKIYRNNDTLVIITVLPVAKMSSAKMPIQTSTHSTNYQGGQITVSAESDLVHYVNFSLSVPDSVEIISDYRVGRVNLNSTGFPVSLSGDHINLAGAIGENSSVSLNSASAGVNLKAVNGEFSLRTFGTANITINGVVNGIVNLHIPDGRVYLDLEGKAERMNVQQRAGTFLFSGNCPDSSRLIFTTIDARFDITGSGNMTVHCIDGRVELLCRTTTFDLLDFAVLDGKPEYFIPDVYEISGDSKKTVAKKGEINDNLLIIRSEKAELYLRVLE